MKKFIDKAKALHVKRNPNPSHQHNPEMPEPTSYKDRPYSSEELIYIFEYALHIDFSHIKAFKEEEASPEEKETFVELIMQHVPNNSPQETRKEGFNLDSNGEARVSLNIDGESLPYVLCSIIKLGMFNWDFVSKARSSSSFALQIYDVFKADFLSLFEEIRKKIEKSHKQSKERALSYKLSEAVESILSPLNEHRSPQLIHTTEMMLIDFIIDLTFHGYHQEAKVLHTFLMLGKKIISTADIDESSREKAIRMLALPVLKGLDLWPETNREAHSFIISMISLGLSHTVFDDAYDAEIYSIYHQIRKKGKELGCELDTTNPSIFERVRGAQSLINTDINSSYRKTLEYISKHKKNASREILKFFKEIIARRAQFNGPKAQAIHNVLYVLTHLYASDIERDNPERRKYYAKALRQVLKIPSLKHNKELDTLFDSLVMQSLIEGDPEQNYKIPYSIVHYEVSKEEVNRFCSELQTEYLDAILEIDKLQVKIQKLEELNDGQALDIERLQKERNNFKKELEEVEEKLEQYEHKGKGSLKRSPQGSKETSPPTPRKGVNRTQSAHNVKESTSLQNSPPKDPSRLPPARSKTENELGSKPKSKYSLEERLEDVQLRLTLTSLEDHAELVTGGSPPKEVVHSRRKQSIEGPQAHPSSTPKPIPQQHRGPE